MLAALVAGIILGKDDIVRSGATVSDFLIFFVIAGPFVGLICYCETRKRWQFINLWLLGAFTLTIMIWSGVLIYRFLALERVFREASVPPRYLLYVYVFGFCIINPAIFWIMFFRYRRKFTRTPKDLTNRSS